MTSARIVAPAFMLTALTYGLARFAYGLLLPDIQSDLGFDTGTAGWIGGTMFATYCAGIFLAMTLDARWSPRFLTVAAGICAAAALTLAAIASNGSTVWVAMALTGLSTGLTSPPLAAAVQERVRLVDRPRANGAINSGTAAGIVLSGLAVLLVSDNWRAIYGSFASIGVITTLWLFLVMPAEKATRSKSLSSPIVSLRTSSALALWLAAMLIGVASTAVWTFGATVLKQEWALSNDQVAMAWIALGIGGLLGIKTGKAVETCGIAAVHRLSTLGMSVAIGGLALPDLPLPWAFAIMACFGLCYIVSSGVLLLWGIAVFENQPAAGLGMPFLVLAGGQTVGASIFGVGEGHVGAPIMCALFAVLMLAAAPVAPHRAPSTS